ncbi:MAG: S8 family serine peptidase [Chloroflexota bacterium]
MLNQRSYRGILYLGILFMSGILLVGSLPLLAQQDPDSLTAVALESITTTDSDVPVTPPEPPQEITNPIVPTTAQSSVVINLDDFRSDSRFSGIDGSGVAVVVLDTGIDLDDPFFGPDNDMDGVADRIVYHEDFADDDDDASDFNGHGSNVTSIVGSSDNTHTGMAPGVNLIHLKVFTNAGSGNFGMTEDALQWVIANAETYNIVSVNMSLGDSVNHTSSQQLYGVSDEINALRNTLGVMVVSASGNDFFGFSSAQGVSYPSADPNSMSIGAVFDANIGSVSYASGASASSTAADRLTPFSQRHQTLTTVFAPGAAIVGAGPGSSLTTQHGTSQATPHIAGIIALMQELALQELGRLLTPAEIDSLLVTTGAVINDGDDENDNVTNTNLNFRRVDVLAIGEAILDMVVETVPPVVTHVDSNEDTGDSSLDDGELTTVSIDELTVTFNEAMNDPSGNGDADDITNPANYLLVESGSNGVLDTAVCGATSGDDTAVTINSVSYDDTDDESTLALNDSNPLSDGHYRFFVCYTVEDEAGNQLDGNGNSTAGTDFSLDFAVDHTAPEIATVGIDGDLDATSGLVVEPIQELILTFSEDVSDPSGDSDSNDVTNPALYGLIGAGPNGVVDTAVCDTLQSDDLAISVDSISYDDTSYTATVAVNGGTVLDDANYRFELCGGTSLTDTAGNFLNNGESNFSFNFEVQTPESFEIFLPLVIR